MTHYFVYWESEDAGSVVTVSAVNDAAPTTGATYDVKTGGGEKGHPSDDTI